MDRSHFIKAMYPLRSSEDSSQLMGGEDGLRTYREKEMDIRPQGIVSMWIISKPSVIYTMLCGLIFD